MLDTIQLEVSIVRILPIILNNTNMSKPINLKTNVLKNNTANDMFIKSEEINFCGANTSAGNILKKLRDITCPYCGVKMISGTVLSGVEKRIDKSKNIENGIKILSGYTDYMQPTEKAMFDIFREYAARNPKATFQSCLQKMYDESLAKLKIEEFLILDKVDNISLKLSPFTALSVRAKTTRCREVILANKKEDTFKRKTFLSSLDEIKPANEEEREILKEMKFQALYLPTSGSSPNAFVVKYANRSEQEIAKRLLRPSVASVEHVKPDSLGGKNSISNFILASAQANSLRANMPLSLFIKRFPDIPQYCQKYIEQVIEAINIGKLKGCEMYPFKIKKTLEKESENLISLDLSSYKYSEKEANNIIHNRRLKQTKK